MTVIDLTEHNVGEVAQRAVEAARRGDLMLFPTDTVYGLGGLAFSARVMEKLCRIKPERSSKPTAVLIDNIIRMSQCAADVPSPQIVALAESFWPGPLTIVWKLSAAVPMEFHPSDHSLGYRMPNSSYLLEVLRELETPMWATSANLPGQRSPRLFSEVAEHVISACDLAIRTQQLSIGTASTVVDVRRRDPVVIREGTIQTEDILRVWKSA